MILGEIKKDNPACSSHSPWNVAMIPQMVSNIGKNNPGPIFLKMRLEGSSEQIYGLECRWGHLYDDFRGNLHEKDSDTDLILCISQMEILLEASNTSISCNQMGLVVYTL